jgi:hypothetical protein
MSDPPGKLVVPQSGATDPRRQGGAPTLLSVNQDTGVFFVDARAKAKCRRQPRVRVASWLCQESSQKVYRIAP